jgi:competence ComEA-like helix-hairpin-helix protein
MTPPAQPETPRQTPDVLAAWPRTAQWAMAFVLGGAVLFMAAHLVLGRLGDARPTQLDRDAMPTTTVDLNRADRAQLRQLPEIGEGLAARIEEYRRVRGGFRSVDELAQVPGIGPNRLARLRPWVRVQGEAANEPADWDRVSLGDRKKPAATGSRKKKSDGPAVPVDLNRASAEQLQTIPGVGPVLAKRILDARARAPFQAVEDLRKVPGIGPKTFQKIRPHVTVGPSVDRTA